jgi:hypothetical protein
LRQPLCHGTANCVIAVRATKHLINLVLAHGAWSSAKKAHFSFLTRAKEGFFAAFLCEFCLIRAHVWIPYYFLAFQVIIILFLRKKIQWKKLDSTFSK